MSASQHLVVETVLIQHLPLTHPVFAVLFRQVRNAPALKQQLLAGNPDFEYAFIDASVIVSRLHVLAAAFTAVNNLLADKLKTRNVHSEIVFALSPNNNIAESFRRFGVSDHTNDLLVLKVPTDPAITTESVRNHLAAAVQGTPAPFDDTELATSADIAKIRKIYKLPLPPASSSIGPPSTATQPVAKLDLEVSILGAMALRGAS